MGEVKWKGVGIAERTLAADDWSSAGGCYEQKSFFVWNTRSGRNFLYCSTVVPKKEKPLEHL